MYGCIFTFVIFFSHSLLFRRFKRIFCPPILAKLICLDLRFLPVYIVRVWNINRQYRQGNVQWPSASRSRNSLPNFPSISSNAWQRAQKYLISAKKNSRHTRKCTTRNGIITPWRTWTRNGEGYAWLRWSCWKDCCNIRPFHGRDCQTVAVNAYKCMLSNDFVYIYDKMLQIPA